MYQLLVMAILLLGLGGCACPKTICDGWEKKIDAEEVSRIVITYSAEMERKHKLFLEDAKVFYDDTIKNISIWYKTQEIMEMCEARALLVDVVDGFLDVLNHDPLVSFQLEERPFTPDDLSITINFESFYTRFLDELYIGLVCLRDGMATYYAGDIKDNLADWQHQRVEPFYKSREFAFYKRLADMKYTDVHKAEEKLVPHPFIFGKEIPLDEARGLPQGIDENGTTPILFSPSF